MPTYQYACTECEHRFEQVQSFSDDSLTECPVCHGRLRKVFNAVGVVFKGSGFYRNDSRTAPGDSGSGGSSTTESPSGSGSGDASSGTEKKAEKSSDKPAASGSDSAKPASSGSEKAS